MGSPQRALENAAKYGDREIIEELIKRGIKPNLNAAKTMAAAGGYLDLFGYLN